LVSRLVFQGHGLEHLNLGLGVLVVYFGHEINDFMTRLCCVLIVESLNDDDQLYLDQ